MLRFDLGMKQHPEFLTHACPNNWNRIMAKYNNQRVQLI
jgi:hypothetical protein